MTNGKFRFPQKTWLQWLEANRLTKAGASLMTLCMFDIIIMMVTHCTWQTAKHTYERGSQTLSIIMKVTHSTWQTIKHTWNTITNLKCEPQFQSSYIYITKANLNSQKQNFTLIPWNEVFNKSNSTTNNPISVKDLLHENETQNTHMKH